MNKNTKLAVITTLVFVVTVSLVLAIDFGLIQFQYNIVSKATMTGDITIDLGTIVAGSTGSGSLADSGKDLTVSIVTPINLVLSGFGGGKFTAFSVTVHFYKGASSEYSKTVDHGVPTAQFTSVAVGTYDIYLEYSYTAGSLVTSGTVTVTVSVP